MIEAGTHESWDARAGSRLRGFLLFVPLVLFAFGSLVPMLLLGAVAPGTFRRVFPNFVAFWGRTSLRLQGVRMEVHGAEHLKEPVPRLVLFNHQSLMDLFVLSATWQENTVVLYKREFHGVPIVGRMLRTMDMIAVDRKNRIAAIESLHEAGRRIVQRRESLLISPEGTRSRADGLLAFKRGPFHLATETGVEIVPMVIRGVRAVLPHDRLVARSGRIRVDVLPPVSTRAWAPSHMDEQLAGIREIFLRYLPDAGDTATERAPPPVPARAASLDATARG